MRSLTHVLVGDGPKAQALPDVYPPLAARDIRFRRGQCTMIAAQPNGGKSMFALNYLIHSGVDGLYISADTDPVTTMLRSAATVLGKTVNEIEAACATTSGAEFVRDSLEELQERIRFSFDPSPSLEDIALEIEAWNSLFGQPPTLIVVDNLMNVVGGNDNEWSAMREAMVALHHIARVTNSCLLVLHHVSENESKATSPAPRRALQGKVSQLPEAILTLAMDPNNNQLKVCAVKNRHGKHDPTGEDYEVLYVDPARMSIYSTQSELAAAAKRREWE
jgi:KaiC/GvpD/RAD55 family RecA-like ATPase